MTPSSASFVRNVVATDTLSNTASTATPGEQLLLLERNAELLERLADLGIDLVETR